MIKFSQGAAALSVLLLAGCGQGEQKAATTADTSSSKASVPVASDMPEPRAGLWRVTTRVETPQGEMALPTTEICQSKDSIREQELPEQAEGMVCNKPSFKRVGNGYQTVIQCKSDSMTAEYRVKLTGDLNTAYDTELVSHISPEPMPGMGQATMRMSAKYLGPCSDE